VGRGFTFEIDSPPFYGRERERPDPKDACYAHAAQSARIPMFGFGLVVHRFEVLLTLNVRIPHVHKGFRLR
jgi:hypothetical protein